MPVWWLEWRLALSDRRRFVLIALVPLLVVVSVATGVAAPEPAAAVYLVVFLAFGVLGSALPLRWDGERGLVERVVRGGVPPGRYLLARAGAGASVDLVQLTPALAVAALLAGASPGALLTAFLALALSLWLASLVGVLAAGLSRSLVETGLAAGVAVLLLAHGSGAFEEPPIGSPLGAVEELSPFRMLYASLLGMTTGVSGTAPVVALGWAVLLPIVVAVLAPAIIGALARVARGGLEGV